MTDQELIEYSAKAIDLPVWRWDNNYWEGRWMMCPPDNMFDPLNHPEDAFMLACILELSILPGSGTVGVMAYEHPQGNSFDRHCPWHGELEDRGMLK